MTNPARRQRLADIALDMTWLRPSARGTERFSSETRRPDFFPRGSSSRLGPSSFTFLPAAVDRISRVLERRRSISRLPVLFITAFLSTGRSTSGSSDVALRRGLLAESPVKILREIRCPITVGGGLPTGSCKGPAQQVLVPCFLRRILESGPDERRRGPPWDPGKASARAAPGTRSVRSGAAVNP
jgi:hypothetical protein